jgi:hypothetical protein
MEQSKSNNKIGKKKKKTLEEERITCQEQETTN